MRLQILKAITMSTTRTIDPSLYHRSIREEEHPNWIRAFQSEARLQQLTEDDRAWSSVTGTLVTIVSIGAILAVISVAICFFA
jgi:hypothetical protein